MGDLKQEFIEAVATMANARPAPERTLLDTIAAERIELERPQLDFVIAASSCRRRAPKPAIAGILSSAKPRARVLYNERRLGVINRQLEAKQHDRQLL